MGDEDHPLKFVGGFCDVSNEQFAVFGKLPNVFRRFTPCVIDTVVLGISYAVAIVLALLRWRVTKLRRSPLYKLKGGARVYQWIAIMGCLLCTIIPVMQLGARLVKQQIPLSPTGYPAPYEYLGLLTPIVSWLLMSIVHIRELKRFTWEGLWLLRFPLVLVAAGQLTKFSFVFGVFDHNLFFYMYLVYVGLHCLLAIFALTHFPRVRSLVPAAAAPDGYQVLSSMDITASMDDHQEGFENPFPESTAGFLSLVTFSWMGGLIRKGYKNPLEDGDVWDLAVSDKSETISKVFHLKYVDEKKKGGTSKQKVVSLVRVMGRTVGHLFLLAIPLKLITDLSQFVGPIFLEQLLKVVDQGKPKYFGFIYAVSMFVGLMLGTIADNQHFQLVMRAGFRLRSVLTSQVHRKSMYLNPTARAKYSSGRIFNFIATDAESLQLLCMNLLGIVSSPIRIIGAMFLLYRQLGPASLVALGSLMIMLPIQAVIVKRTAVFIKKAVYSTDERAKLEGELFTGIEVVKCNAWEDPLCERILDVRKTELKVLWNSFVLGAINMFLMMSIPAIVAVATFAVYVATSKDDLTAGKAFTSVTLFGVLRLPLFQVPQLVTQLTQASVSIRRLEEFFAEDEQMQRPELSPSGPGENVISVHGNFTWNTELPPFLKNIHLDIMQGSLVVIVGSTGSGKSSLASAMLGLMEDVMVDKAPIVKGKIALVPQSPFIFNATVKDNILFGEEFDADRYARAIEAACLNTDLEALPGGDHTELGERGINVSGGQKQRIAIARATYSGADVIVMDDPLSALDSKVGRKVFNRCLLGELDGKTRVLVTNQLQFVSSADLIVYLSDGEIVELGRYTELMAKKGPFAQLMAENQVEEGGDDEDDEEKDTRKKKSTPWTASLQGRPSRTSDNADDTDEKLAPGVRQDAQLIKQEERTRGILSLHVLWEYSKAMGGILPLLFLMVQFLLVETFRASTSLWLTYWTKGHGKAKEHSDGWYMNIYTAISFGQIIFTLVNSLDLKWVGRIAANDLHNTMLKTLLKAPMAFFHTTPVGRIINRCTKDTYDIDRLLTDYVGLFLRSLLQLLSTVIMIGAFTPFTLPCLVPILLLFYFLYTYFQTSVREIKRLDAVSRSPVYSSVNDAINGLATIKAFTAESRLIQRNMELVDANVRMNLANQSMNRWLSIRLETLGAFTALFAGVLAVEKGGDGAGASAVMGLTLSYALQITALTSMTVRLASLAENSFNAVERIVEYGHLDPESDTESGKPLPPEWPDKGSLVFEGVKMRYRPGLPLVLHGLSVGIEGGQKIGVVGRTGAGKSSLINALFRLAEIDDGRIIIDGLDISQIRLNHLRGRMAIIPQAPVLFTGSIRSNLDPFSAHSDCEIWTALQRSHLRHAIESSSMGLDMRLQEGGAPLSAGQKQLLTLARALLTRSKILVLDEATANVDVETDALIQKTIREEFADCTVIAVAHRLHTIIDGDKVLVLDKGRLAEFDSPAALLMNRNGVFTSMVHETGEATERFLRDVALGKLSITDVQAQDASRGLERLATPVDLSMVSLSLELMERATSTVSTLQTVKQQLHMQQEAYKHKQGASKETMEEAGKDLLNVLKNALHIVREVQDLAESTNKLIETEDIQESLAPLVEIEEVGNEMGTSGASASKVDAEALTRRTGSSWAKVRAAAYLIGLQKSTLGSHGMPAEDTDHPIQF